MANRLPILTALLLATAPAGVAAQDVLRLEDAATAGMTQASQSTFTQPVLLLADGEPMRVEAPGYAAPSTADVNGDGYKDVVVGQFNDGKMMVYLGKADGTFGKGEWLKAGGTTAKVPGVW
jgi:hypothetical protein